MDAPCFWRKGERHVPDAAYTNSLSIPVFPFRSLLMGGVFGTQRKDVIS